MAEQQDTRKQDTGKQDTGKSASAGASAKPARVPTPEPQLSFGERWVYDDAPEARDHVQVRERYDLFIDGGWRAPTSKDYFTTTNPATEEELATVAQAGEADVDAAVGAARRAQDEVWGPMSGKDRSRYIFRIARILQERARELAVLESLDGGKPIRESRDVDVPLTAAHFFYHAGWADKLHLAFPGASAGKAVRPKGVVGQVIPWNFPLLMAAWKLAPALCCGNTVVLKPAETTPLTALHLAQVMEQAELPAGVVNIVTGDGRTGAALVKHPGLDKVAFTGSTEVGKQIQTALAGTGVDLTQRWTRRWRASCAASSSTRATSVALARACWCRRASTTSSWRS
jgi:aldehyde dehydrogenase (NAD+)